MHVTLRCLRSVVLALSVLAGLTLAAGLTARPLDAHGSTQQPPSRVYTCRFHDRNNPMCAAAWESNAQALYDWMEVNLGDVAGRHRNVIPDGQLCSAGRSKYAAFDQPGAWPVTALQADGSGLVDLVYENTAPHSTEYYRVYLTNAGFDARTDPLGWGDLELVYDSGRLDRTPQLTMRAALPVRDRPAILYIVWQRSDSPEAFYACSDVTISNQGAPAPTTTPAPSSSTVPTSTVPPSTTVQSTTAPTTTSTTATSTTTTTSTTATSTTSTTTTSTTSTTATPTSATATSATTGSASLAPLPTTSATEGSTDSIGAPTRSRSGGTAAPTTTRSTAPMPEPRPPDSPEAHEADPLAAVGGAADTDPDGPVAAPRLAAAGAPTSMGGSGVPGGDLEPLLLPGLLIIGSIGVIGLALGLWRTDRLEGLLTWPRPRAGGPPGGGLRTKHYDVRHVGERR